MFAVVMALWPVFALLIAGYLCIRSGFLKHEFWQSAEKLTYFVLFPALLVERLANAAVDTSVVFEVGLSITAMLIFGSVLCYLLKPWLKIDLAGFTSFYQGSLRFNTYVGLAATSALLGDGMLVIAAVVLAIMIPLLNLLCILVFSLHLGAGGIRGVLMTTLKNPLIVSCCVGILLNISGVGLPFVFSSVAQLLGQVALPLGLLAVGAGLNLSVLRSSQRIVWLSSAIKLLFLPLFIMLFSNLAELSQNVTGLLLVFASLPTASSAYILARQLGGDAPLMAAIITGQTLISIVSMPLILGVLL